MKRHILLATVAAVATLVSTVSQATPYLDPVLWLNAANPGSRLATLPAQTLALQDGFGSYTYAQRGIPVVVGLNSISNDPNFTSINRISIGENLNNQSGAGQLTGAYGCVSAIGPLCLGVHTITYKLDRKVFGFAGQLDYRFGTGDGDDISFFGLPSDYFNPNASETIPLSSYQGFFGKIFDQPTDTFTIGWRPLGKTEEPIGADDFAFFRMSSVVALIPGNSGGGATPVPEPVSLAIFGMGLAGLASVTRRRRKTGAVAV